MTGYCSRRGGGLQGLLAKIIKSGPQMGDQSILYLFTINFYQFFILWAFKLEDTNLVT